jgi:hypothetical protein
MDDQVSAYVYSRQLRGYRKSRRRLKCAEHDQAFSFNSTNRSTHGTHHSIKSEPFVISD